MKQLLIFFLLFLIGATHAQEKKDESPIDKALTKCLDKEGINNADMCNCFYTAIDSWDKELNKYYKLLLGELPKEASEVLKQSQRQWITYRDKEYEFISTYYYEVQQGTMWYAIAASKKMDIVKDRALKLQDYHDTLY